MPSTKNEKISFPKKYYGIPVSVLSNDIYLRSESRKYIYL